MRLRDAVCTVLLWAGYLYLMRNVFSVLLSLYGIFVPWGAQYDDNSFLDVSDRLLGYSVAIMVNTCMLIAWARYNQFRFGRRNRRRRSPAVTAEEVGSFFALTPEQVAACQRAKRNVMFHDERGHLVAFGSFRK